MKNLICFNNYFFCFIFLISLINCQFNINPIKKKNFFKNEKLENKVYPSELQNHKITDQKVDDQVIQSNTIKVEENFSPTTNIRNFPPTMNEISTVNIPSTINIQSTGNEPSLVNEQTTVNEDNLPNTSQSLTSFQMNRLPQSSTPHTSQDVTVSTKNNQILAYSPNNLASSPSLISSIFSKMNQPVAGSFYPYNYNSYSPNGYSNQYYNNYLGYNSYPGSYPYYNQNGYYGGNTIANAFYSKMRPIVNFFQRLTGKSNYGYTPYYGGSYTNGVYNNYNDYDTYRYGLYKGALLHKDSLLEKSENPSKLNHVLNSSASENQLSEFNKFSTE